MKMGLGANKTILKNGIRIVTKKMPHIRSVSVGVWVNVGARDESLAESGLSHFIEHMIFKGTEKRSAFQIAKEFDAIGGHTNAFTSLENTCYHAKVIDTHLETVVDILSDIFLNSLFDEKEVENERTIILQEIGMVEDNSEEYVHILSGNNFWGQNSLGRSILGPRENILGFTADTIKDFFCRFYQPDRIVISAAGSLEHDRLVDLVGPAFESVRPGNGFPERIMPDGRPLVDLRYRDLEQVHVCLATKGISITNPKRYAYSLMNTLLGGNMSSRLFQEIRERRGLAYSVYSFISSYVDTGIFGAYVGVDPKNAFESTTTILKEMGKLKATRVGADELGDAKEYTKGNLLLASENNDNQMVRLAQNETHFGRYIPLEDVIDNIESVTQDDILELAEALFKDNCFALTMLGAVGDKAAYENILTI
ncbi:MAG: insulinase family protein [Desulfobacterales bacterium]|uniref:Insulinase family protein n=1 Tax=Candidatus Desulfatibia profunda TaxID=2841695 RepID=A0A8J6TH12_9BACT|nr:insulinase family protein [Candidatus Desulfatibia profunda]MBL7179602.1 insulinase family protein [Desulfobacterales bacterium]